MTETESLITRIYAAFNGRDVDCALSFMTADVSWPRASEGGRVTGKQQIRDYWTRQWQAFDPHVEPLEVLEEEAGRARVRVHQLVKSLAGDILSDTEVWHTYTLAGGLIGRMDLGDGSDNTEAPSAAFANH